jgi:hypothetical protein
MDSQALMQHLMFKLQRSSNNKQKVLSLMELSTSSCIMHQWFYTKINNQLSTLQVVALL